MIHKDLSHHLRRQRKKVNSALPIAGFAVYQTEVGFMDKCGWLQGMITALSGQVSLRHPAQFLIDEGNEGVPGGDIPTIPADKQFSDSVPRIRSHSVPQTRRAACPSGYRE